MVRSKWPALRLLGRGKQTELRTTAPENSGFTMDQTVGREIVRSGIKVDIGRHMLADRSSFMTWYQDAEIAELLRHDLSPLTPIQARGYFDSVIMPTSQRGTCWAIVLHSTGELLGSTALVDMTDGGNTALFRIVIGEKLAWGRGYGTETTSLVLKEAFERFKREDVRLEVFVHNPRAQRAYLKAGFRQVGQHQEWVSRAARQITVAEMRITREEWLTDQSAHDDFKRDVFNNDGSQS